MVKRIRRALARFGRECLESSAYLSPYYIGVEDDRGMGGRAEVKWITEMGDGYRKVSTFTTSAGGPEHPGTLNARAIARWIRSADDGPDTGMKL